MYLILAVKTFPGSVILQIYRSQSEQKQEIENGDIDRKGDVNKMISRTPLGPHTGTLLSKDNNV
jgi:hypothetical protein